MLDEPEFLDYLAKQLPVGFLDMMYKEFKLKQKGKITSNDVTQLESQLKLGKFKDII